MNKLLTKIVGLSLGLSMAIGVGVAASYSEKDAVETKASQQTVTFVAGTDTSSTTSLTKGAITITVSSGTFSRTDNYRCYANNTLTVSTSNGTLNSINFTFSGSYTGGWDTSYSGLTSNTWTSASASAQARMTKIEVVYDESSTPTLVVDPSYEFAKNNSSKISVAYSNFTSGIAISATSTDESVATIAASTTTTGSSGNAEFAVTPVGVGSTTIKFNATGADEVGTTVIVYEEQEFTHITKSGNIVDGGHYLISKSGSDIVMSTTQESTYRRSTTAVASEDYSTLTTQNAEAAVLVITAGTGTYSGYYTLFDPTYVSGSYQGGYLEYYSGLKTYGVSGTPAQDYFYWSITFSNNHAIFTNKSNTTFQIRYNNSGTPFGAYSSTTGSDVDLYLLSSEITPDVDLSTITVESTASVQNGSFINFSGSYTPINATESIVATLLDNTLASLSSIVMSNGQFSITITGESVGSTTLSFAGENGHGSASLTLTVTAYVATHNKVTSTSGLYNGIKVILGNSENSLVSAAHTGGNNVPAVAGSFSEDGSSLSNASGTGNEYTLWYLTIKDSSDNDVSGWAFYDDGHYLTCTTTADKNYWKQTLELTSLCLFNIQFVDGVTSIVCADSSVAKNTLSTNTDSKCFSAYSSCTNAVDLYSKESSSDAAIMAGFEDFFLMIDVDLTSHGYCTSKHWYDYAKDAYNNTLTPAQKALITSAASARLSAWAAANGDTLSGGSLSAKTTTGLLMIGDGATAITIIVIIAAISITSIGALLVLKKRKEQF